MPQDVLGSSKLLEEWCIIWCDCKRRGNNWRGKKQTKRRTRQLRAYNWRTKKQQSDAPKWRTMTTDRKQVDTWLELSQWRWWWAVTIIWILRMLFSSSTACNADNNHVALIGCCMLQLYVRSQKRLFRFFYAQYSTYIQCIAERLKKSRSNK